MPKLIRKFHQELTDDIGSALLGYYHGDDLEILGAYTDKYREAAEAQLQKGKLSNDLLYAMAQIRTEEAAEVLIDLLPRVPMKLQAGLLRALAWQGGEQALPVLRNQRRLTSDPKLIEVIDAAISYLECPLEEAKGWGV